MRRIPEKPTLFVYNTPPRIGTIVNVAYRGGLLAFRLLGTELMKRKDGTSCFALWWQSHCVKCSEIFETYTPLVTTWINKKCAECKRKDGRYHFMAILRGRKKAKAIREGRYVYREPKKEMPRKEGYIWDKRRKRYMRFLPPRAKNIEDIL